MAWTQRSALAHYARVVGRTRARQSVAVVQRYLAWGGTNTDASLQAYCQALAHQGYASSTLDWICRTIASFYRHLGVPAPRYRYPHTPSAERRVAVTPEWVLRWIAAVRADPLWAADAQLVCMSTLYGLRVGELAALEPGCFDATRARVWLAAEKASVSRWCWWPPAVQPICTPWVRRSRQGCYAALHRTVEAAGLPAPPGLGWHSIRRALASALDAAGVPPLAISRFLRWAVGERQFGQLPRYTQPTERVGVSGPETGDADDPGSPAYDPAVWARHPFLAAWQHRASRSEIGDDPA